MVRRILKAILVLLCFAFFALFLGLLIVALANKSLLEPIGKLWFELSTSSLNGVQAFTERRLWAPLWSHGVSPLLHIPAGFAFPIPALVFYFLLRRLLRRRPDRWW